MTDTSPPPEAQRFGRSQTPESPRPVHIPEPANIPVLLNQMDPVFNDTATYNIPHNQTFSSFPDPTSEQVLQRSNVDEHDAVQNFFREAEHQAAAEPEPSVINVQNALQVDSNVSAEANPFPYVTLSENPTEQQEKDPNTSIAQSATTLPLENLVVENASTDREHPTTEQQRIEGPILTNNLNDQSQQPQQEQLISNSDNEGGIDYQSLLDTISQSASTAPTASTLTALTTAASNNEDGNRLLPSFPGLPPKPPPQERPIEFPTYSSYENAAAPNPSHGVIAQGPGDTIGRNGTDGQEGLSTDQNSLQSVGAEGYPVLPLFSSATHPATPQSAQLPMLYNQMAPGTDVGRNMDPLERPWSPRTQVLYDQFLEDERRYVTEGIWDKFPLGSRLFVGNLPSEKVTKRDLFHKFHQHGQLAQISIKQAYGFVQFLEASSCAAALAAEQGVEIRGRKVHLEISKPQKNTRNATANAGSGGGNKNQQQQQQRRRSRSPDRNNRRDNRNYSDFRDEPNRRKDEFRNRRSPSPRAYRQRDEYRSSGREGRSRSPLYGNKFETPSAAPMDDEASLQLPRRDPRQVPDVQLLVLEAEVVQSFINWIEQGFRNKGLQASTIWVTNRFPMPAVIKRQIIEGVQAVVKLTRVAQNNSRIPLQVFDRSAGASNVTYNEYVDLDVHIAADVVIQARQKERGGQAAQGFRPQVFSPPAYQPPAQYGIPQPPYPFPQPTPPQYPSQQPGQPPQYSPQLSGQPPQYAYPNAQQSGYRPTPQPPTPTNQPPNLQQLLATLRQPPSHAAAQNQAATSQNGQPMNVPSFIGSNGGGQQPYIQGQPGNYSQYSTGPAPQAGQQPNVQNIMEQLARYGGR